tara:strand:- start:49896 stop:51164 length:1269 start_codon:yes stop_codon:yes gene_type:complete
MSEDFLHYVWKFKLFNLHQLKTTDGQEIEVVSVGDHNTESGPDFFNAKIKIGDLVWVGQVEMHLNSTDWYRHQHQSDLAYLKTVLHVVMKYDEDVFDVAGNPIPTLELNGRISNQLISNYNHLKLAKNKLVCQGLTGKLDEFQTGHWLGRLLIERLERKVMEIAEIHERTKGNWEQTVFIQLAKNFGFKTNALPMQLLAERIDFKILIKNRNNGLVLEAILLGVAGLLEDELEDDYAKTLQKEFTHQKNKYQFKVLAKEIWKFGGVRPSNFPTIRLVQMTQIIQKFGNLFGALIRDFSINQDWKELNVSVSTFWETHYTLQKVSVSKKKRLGKSAVNMVLINTVAPLLFYYGKETANPEFQEKAVDLLESLPSESNSITKIWKENNIFAKRASESQSLIELTNNYCKPKKCLTCGIGKQILQ